MRIVTAMINLRLKDIFSKTIMPLIVGFFLHPSVAFAQTCSPEKIGQADFQNFEVPLKGKLLKSFKYSDSIGQHIVIFTKKENASKFGRIERHILRVESYFWGNEKSWTKEWGWKNQLSCPNLDSESKFLMVPLEVSDLDSDSICEITFAYKTFCGGGIEPSDIGVVLQAGKNNFNISGTNIVKLLDNGSMGGTKIVSQNLYTPQNETYLKHLNKMWTLIENTK